MGTSGKLARWDGMLEYFGLLAARSDRIRVDTLGPTTLGNPFVVVTMSSKENLRRLDEIHATSAILAKGRVSREEAERLATDLPATTFINHNIHSTEIGSSQTSVVLVHRLATSDDPEVLEILDNVVTILIPSANPDGQIMVTDWYEQVRDSDTPRARMPYVYHHYAGHDNTAISSRARWWRPDIGLTSCSSARRHRCIWTSIRWAAPARGCSCPPIQTR